MSHTPDYTNLVAAIRNQRPSRLPLYEHNISPVVMERVLGCAFAHLDDGDPAHEREFFRHFCRFFEEMTYDTVSYEYWIPTALPVHGALNGGRPGPIQSRADFEAYPWDRIPGWFWEQAAPRFDALAESLPAGMKAVGGLGNGVFEISEDLVGYEWLCLLQEDEPELVTELYARIGDLMVTLWSEFIRRWGDAFCVMRFGDDLGFKSSTLMSPDFLRTHVVAQYRRVIGCIKDSGKPFIWHSCGKIFPVMDDVIACGIDAKHSNEDQIAPFDEWIARYNDRIALLGGIDVDLLCREDPGRVYELVVEAATRYRASAKGYALGSGNSIPDYVPTEGYLAMVRAAQEIRRREALCTV
jgi:uroporphyrinogen decarboxylase